MLSRRLISDEMRIRRLACSLMLCVALTCGQHALATEPVVRLEFLDPVRGAGHVARPCVSIDADGFVRWCEPGEVELREGRIGRERQSELLRELAVSLDIDAIDSETLWQEIEAESRRTGLSPRIEGAGITRITVSLPDTDTPSEVVVECPACQLLATRYPGVESLQRFARCQKLLENLRAVMQLGGFEEAERVTELANTHLADLGHMGDPLCCGDLCFVRRLPDGVQLATYHRKGSPDCHLTVTLEPGRSPVFEIVQ